MKKLLFASLAFVALNAGAALAADMPVKARPLPPPVISWTGWYAGVHLGVARIHGPSMTYDDLCNITQQCYFPANVDPHSTGIIGGIHGGFNWQFASNWLLGIEADIDGTDLRNSDIQRLVCLGASRPQCGGINIVFTDTAFLETKVNWLASARGRLGFIGWNNWLFYGTGGVAWADLDLVAQVDCSNIQPSFCNGATQRIRTEASGRRNGWVAGGGIEYKSANWIVGAEYLSYRFGDTNTADGSWFNPVTGAPAPFFACTIPGQNCARFTFRDFTVQSVRFRVSYQFDVGKAPVAVMAKY
jgi:outer membrane immunogenic protein